VAISASVKILTWKKVMKIKLSEIPEEGETWSLNQNTAELNEALKDLIGPCSYQIQMSIRPLSASATYDLAGSIKTELPEQCSRCGLDFKMPIQTKFHHLLMPVMDIPRDAQYSKTNHFSDLHESDLETAEYLNGIFDAGEFFHELVALAEPLNPAPPVDEAGKCGICHISVKDHNFGYDENVKTKNKPFASLKGIKFDS